MGTEPHRSAGVATTGVALRTELQGSLQEAGQRKGVATIGVALKKAVCKGQESSVQEAVCRKGSVQIYLTDT